MKILLLISLLIPSTASYSKEEKSPYLLNEIKVIPSYLLQHVESISYERIVG
jgi:hypothetical protein